MLQAMSSKLSRKLPLTHFLCIPLVNSFSKPFLERSLHAFKLDFSRVKPHNVEAYESGDPADTEWSTAVRPVGTLHLTLGVMSLGDGDKLERAIELLTSLDLESILRKVGSEVSTSADLVRDVESHKQIQPLVISLNSLRPMQKPKATAVLYAVAEDKSQRLLPFCKHVKHIFTDRGFLLVEARPLKLHATVANTIYAKLRVTKADAYKDKFNKVKEDDVVVKQASHLQMRITASSVAVSCDTMTTYQREQEHASRQDIGAESLSRGNKQKHGKHRRLQAIRFDFSELLNQYHSFTWVTDVVLDRIAICEMGANKVYDESGAMIGEAYKEIATISMPV